MVVLFVFHCGMRKGWWLIDVVGVLLLRDGLIGLLFIIWGALVGRMLTSWLGRVIFPMVISIGLRWGVNLDIWK